MANGRTDPFRLVQAFHFKGDAGAKMPLKDVALPKCATQFGF